MAEYTAQYAAGNQCNGFTGYLTHGPCSGFEGNGIMIYFDTKANAEAAWTSKSGITRSHQGMDFRHATIDGIEVFFRWETPAWP